MKPKRKIIEINQELCDGCGQCVTSCAEGAIKIVNGKATLIRDSFCDGLGACIGECPTGALKIIEREAEEFDHEAVEEHVKRQEEMNKKLAPMGCGCPSSNIRMLDAACEKANQPSVQSGGPSALRHWPVQIKLVPPTAPFLRDADLLVAADCTPIAYPDFHRDFLQGRAVLLGCPKLDDAQGYVGKFTEIFKTANIRSITVVDMEVPCCSALPAIVQKAMQAAGKVIPMEEVTLSVNGEILKRKQFAA
jgi:ferredoxin